MDFTLPRFTDETAAREHLEAMRWPKGPECPHCGGVERNSRMLGVTYKTAWFMSHRIREAFKVEQSGPLGGGGKVVEADETYIGSNRRPRSGKRGPGPHL